MADWFSTNAPKEESGDWFAKNAPSSGPGRGGRKVDPDAKVQTSPTDAGFGMDRFATGVDQLTNLGGNRDGQKLKGLHNAITGAGEIAAPMAVVPLVANPVGAIVGIAGGAAGGAAGKFGAAAAGASEDVSDLAGDAGAMVGGYAGEALGSTSKWLGSLAERLRLRKPTLEAKPKLSEPKTEKPTGQRHFNTGPAPEPEPPAPAAPQRHFNTGPGSPPAKPEPPAPQRHFNAGSGAPPEKPVAPVAQRHFGMTSGTATASPKAEASLPKPKTEPPVGAKSPVDAPAKPMPGQPPAVESEAHSQAVGKMLRGGKNAGYEGIRPDAAEKLNEPEWKALFEQAGFKGKPTQVMIDAAKEHNRKLWAASQKDLQARREAHFAKTPKTE